MPRFSTLVRLLSASLFGRHDSVGKVPLPLSEEEWSALFDLSRREAVTALLYDAILLLPKEQRPPKSVLFHFLSMVQTIEEDNRVRESALTAFASLMKASLSLPTNVVKGTSLSRRFPKPEHRECGDNDLYTGADTETIAAYMESQGLYVERKDPRHVSFSYKDVTFECHNYLLYHQDDPAWLFTEQSDGLCFLPSWQEAFFIAKHIEHHTVFFHNPVRLRDLVDWTVLLTSEDFDYAAFADLKKGTDVDVFADMMSLYCESLFGIELAGHASRTLAKGLKAEDFEPIYMRCPERHRLAVVRVARRSGKYIRYWRQYKKIYGMSMFRRFYFSNLRVAIKQSGRKSPHNPSAGH